MTDDEARIKARYPKRSALDYVLGIGALVAVVGAIAMVLIDGLDRANPPVAAMVRGFEVVSPQEAVAEVVVQRKDPATPVECSLYAQAKSYERVAEHTFTVDPGTEVLTVVHVDLKTIKEATTISMEEPACRVLD
ncbi:DUF4307 domain-containing protein [Tessaracoccus flavescens]|uniref:DUF4307 domain-containing protein n=1 Tax=Tessaracoccus flavescens TaxID=399497 RepID=A0A1Q2CZB4_9ACTN|nr:DUF4307 domain-containing protein [Tessaracoccus flavescens]AQP51448.1 hypothetical protein BW733_12110 [Tessaracoccus flavescens]